jgi:peroxiredoxin
MGIRHALISDPPGAIALAYQARRPFGPKTRRLTYVIDSEGMITDAFQHELRIRHIAPRALTALRALIRGNAAPADH